MSTQLTHTTGGVKRIQSTCAYVGLGKSKIYELVAAGTFPRPIELGTPRAKAWITSELDAWISEQAAKRSDQE